MKKVTIQEFSRLSKIKDSDLHRQIMEIPGTITPDKLFEAAERSGYHIIPERTIPDMEAMEALSLDELDMVVGGRAELTPQERLSAFHTWIYLWMGYDY